MMANHVGSGFGCGGLRGWIGGAGLALLCALAGVTTSCLDRPVAPSAPATSNVFVDQVLQTSVDKIDLLFMIDNSASMADKQEILKSAVPVLVNRLTSPICVDAKGQPTRENSVSGKCTVGSPEFPPIADIHVGIVTSSLGAHGGDVCPSQAGYSPNDQAHLLGTVRAGTFDVSKTWNNSGFLAWDPDQKDQPPGARDAGAFQKSFQDMIAAAGETGCGFEASLESWYRFLIDPEPPVNVTITTGASPRTVRGSQLVIEADGSTTCMGCDLDLLAQRKAFLRPDSLVAIVMLSDENDCSIRDDGQGYLAAKIGSSPNLVYLPRATSACAANPNDPCCRSCASSEASPPTGCLPLSADPSCSATTPPNSQRDAAPLRCYDQKRRFGFDFLYPTSRYVNALSNATLTLQSDGKTKVPNPLFDSGTGKAPRDPSLVFLAGIVGVPWQDIADEPSLSGAGLNYLSSAELEAKGRWPMLLGDPSASPPVAPSDPFMVESPAPRSGMNPVTGDAIMPASSTSPTASPINGHEQNVPGVDDLQYACTFRLTTPKPCAAGDNNCDCSAKNASESNSPLCQGVPANQQGYAKAYPGARELQVLKDFKDQAIVASICPKLTESPNPESDPNYGYNPAVAAIIDRLKVALVGKCLPRAPQINPDTGAVACQVIEARPSGCDCNLPGRAPIDSNAEPGIIPAVLSQLESTGSCGVPGKPACSSFCACEIRQEVDQGAVADLTACQQNRTPSQPGYCYIDDPASAAVENCPANQKRILHFVDTPSNRIPANDAIAFIACLGAPIAPAGAATAP